MPKCSVKKCKNNTLYTLKKDGISYFRFPKNEIEREKWRQIIATERGEEFFKPNDSSVVCSCHFSDSDMYFTKKGFRKIKKDVLPQIQTDLPRIQSVNAGPPTDMTLGLLQNEPSTSKLDTSKSIHPTETTTKTINSPIKLEREEFLELHQKIEEKTITTQSVTQDKQAPEINIIDRSSSPTSSELHSILDSPKTSHYKRSLRICERTIELKNKQIQNLKKKNNRLMKRNMSLKEMVADLKKKRKKILF